MLCSFPVTWLDRNPGRAVLQLVLCMCDGCCNLACHSFVFYMSFLGFCSLFGSAEIQGLWGEWQNPAAEYSGSCCTVCTGEEMDFWVGNADTRFKVLLLHTAKKLAEGGIEKESFKCIKWWFSMKGNFTLSNHFLSLNDCSIAAGMQHIFLCFSVFEACYHGKLLQMMLSGLLTRAQTWFSSEGTYSSIKGSAWAWQSRSGLQPWPKEGWEVSLSSAAVFPRALMTGDCTHRLVNSWSSSVSVYSSLFFFSLGWKSWPVLQVLLCSSRRQWFL